MQKIDISYVPVLQIRGEKVVKLQFDCPCCATQNNTDDNYDDILLFREEGRKFTFKCMACEISFDAVRCVGIHDGIYFKVEAIRLPDGTQL